MLKKIFIIFSCLVASPLWAGEPTGGVVVPPEIAANSSVEQALREDSVAILLTSGILPSQPIVSSPRSYTVVPLSVGGLWTLDEIGNDNIVGGWLRGNTSLRITPFYHEVIHGPESRFAGLMVGPQYNFVQKGWDFVPFIGSQVGIAFCDSGRQGHLLYQQGQDFCFTFGVEAGVRYFLSRNWSLIGELAYQHFSNAGLSEPTYQNNGLDLLGPQFSLAYTF